MFGYTYEPAHTLINKISLFFAAVFFVCALKMNVSLTFIDCFFHGLMISLDSPNLYYSKRQQKSYWKF